MTTMNALPTLRSKVIKYFSVLIGLYAGLGLFLLICVLLASATTPKMIHLNYDSISAASQMKESWMALDHPREFRGRARPDWQAQFERALKFEEGNITEPGEGDLAGKIRALWLRNSGRGNFSPEDSQQMLSYLDSLVAINEKGMFSLADSNTSMSRKVLIFSVIYLLASLIFAFFVADALAARLSGPLKSIAEALHRRPKVGSRLKLVEPSSLELLILTTELKRLWDRVSQAEKLNVNELLQQKSKLETVLESAEDAILVVDMGGIVTHCNQFMLKLLSLETGQVIGQKWTDLPSIQENYLRLRSILQEGMADSSEVELTVGTDFLQLSARRRKIGSDPESPIATLYMLHDITERRQRERFRSEFIDMLSHEIKTPLQSLGTAAELLLVRKGELPEGLQLLAETIHEDAERMKAVASEFVQVTHGPARAMKLNFQKVNLGQLIPEWIRPFRVVGKDKNVSVDFVLVSGSDEMAKVDPVKFPWVISNLLSNAIRFSPMGGKVEVRLAVEGGAVRIAVTDEGPGVPREDQGRIFDAFFQGQHGLSSGKPGLFGIGLTIAREVVEAHGGTISYQKLSPLGSEFDISLPAAT
jgi:two-component system, NtrC family, sensor histidine kinase KinB